MYFGIQLSDKDKFYLSKSNKELLSQNLKITKLVLAKIFNNKKLKTEKVYIIANIDNVEYIIGVLDQRH